MLESKDTIVALATPAGRSGVGVIRLSGETSLLILKKLVGSDDFNPQPNFLKLRTLFDPLTHETIDQALVCYFKAPHSFTGEDIVELHCHGSPLVLRAILDATLMLDARMATAGEFSLRAVANGQMTLSEAEGIRDLVDAQTHAAVRQATRQMKGAISNALQPLKEDLLKMIVRLESSLEFVEDDLPAVEQDQLLASLRGLRAQLESMANTFSRGRLLREGIRVTLVGRPNAGKSSLFNSLLGRSRAIVTDVPGTTRDTISEAIDLEGVPLVLTDTAGLRESTDPIELIGVARTRREAADSDLVILVIDGSESLREDDRHALFEAADLRRLVALNKSDLETFSPTHFPHEVGLHVRRTPIISVSAKTSKGLDSLRAAIIKSFSGASVNGESLLITNARHHDLLMRANEALQQSEKALIDKSSEEIILVGLHNALRCLGDITGETTTDEILGKIFSTFCVGK